jgi:hypothetical protein
MSHSPEDLFWGLLDPQTQRQVLTSRYDRARMRQDFGPPTKDDGVEWVYVGKFEDSSAVSLGMLMAATASLDNPVWKTIVVTFDQSGIVERIRVGSLESSVSERQRQTILFGTYHPRESRVRAATEPATQPERTQE